MLLVSLYRVTISGFLQLYVNFRANSGRETQNYLEMGEVNDTLYMHLTNGHSSIFRMFKAHKVKGTPHTLEMRHGASILVRVELENNLRQVLHE